MVGSSLKQGTSTLLGQIDALGDENRERLRALSVTTVEELFGLIAADPEATSEFLGPNVDLASIQADIGRAVGPQAMASLSEMDETRFSLGASPPPGLQLSAHADLDVFERQILPAAQVQGVPPGPGVNISSCMGPVRFQGERGTCVSYAVCALVECLTFKTSGSRLDLSEQFLYWNAKEHDGKPNAEGTLIEVAVGLSVSDGNCLEQTWPYNESKIPGNEGQGPPPPAAAPEAAKHRLGTPEPVNERSPEAVRGILDEGRPVALSVPVYRNWDGNPDVNTRGYIPMPLPNSKLVGGHAMCAVGYSSDTGFAGGGYLILRNSWGPDWAAQSPIAPGHALLPYLYLELYGWECYTATM
jgi:Papain family cysteine protease